MIFLHFSDTHLGKTNYKLKEREEDYYNAFEQCVNIAIEKKVDFVIHTGDLFDQGNPTHKSIINCIRQLSKLKNANIPLFIIAGSHDMSIDETVISILEEIELVTNLSNPKYYETNQKILLKGKFYKNVFLCGIAGRQANIKEIFENVEINPESVNADYKIFMFHHTISDISTKFMDIPTNLLPKGFDYYAGGHWHTNFKTKYDTGIIQYSGSTEYTDITDMEIPQKKQALLINTMTKTITPMFIKTREIIIEKFDCENMIPKQVTQKCLSLIKNKPYALIIFRPFGRLKEGSKNMVDRQLIREKAKENNYLHCKVYLTDLLNPQEKKLRLLRHSKNIELDYLKTKGYSQKEIELAKIIIGTLGTILKKDGLEKATQKIMAEFEK
ncbi:MAG: DNA repair exonuclease [Nanoarchaeota archaeon]|nr:DNA repair exonuclease [Nanoarchaeota archaeon]